MKQIVSNIIKLSRNNLVIILSFFMCVNVLYVDAFALEDDNDSLDNYMLNNIEDNNIDY